MKKQVVRCGQTLAVWIVRGPQGVELEVGDRIYVETSPGAGDVHTGDSVAIRRVGEVWVEVDPEALVHLPRVLAVQGV